MPDANYMYATPTTALTTKNGVTDSADVSDHISTIYSHIRG